MLNDTPFYHGTIRNTIIAFGRLFSNIRFERKVNGSVDGTTEQIIQVPIAYSQKEKWVHSLEQNPDGERGLYTSLPRLAFEITGYGYDASRKLNRMSQVTCETQTGKNAAFTPVPYNIELALYFATKTQEDGLQILEQILPTFSPEYTVAVNAVPSLGIIQDTPFVLGSVSVQDDYEGDLETRRFVVHTLTFTAKVNLFGLVTDSGVIKQTEMNITTIPGTSGFFWTNSGFVSGYSGQPGYSGYSGYSGAYSGYSGYSGELGHMATQADPEAAILEVWFRDF